MGCNFAHFLILKLILQGVVFVVCRIVDLWKWYWVQEYLAASAEEAAAKERKRLCENRLKESRRDHYQATTPGGYPVSWKSVGGTRLDGKKLKADLPDIFAKYTTESSSRSFSIGSPCK